MRFFLLILLITLLVFSGCSSESRNAESAGVAYQKGATVAEPRSERAPLRTVNDYTVQTQAVSLSQVDSLSTVAQAAERKIIRNGNLTIEVNSPAEVQRKIASIAESHQGFVVTSEATQRTTDDRTKPEITVNLVVRVPAAQFDQTMNEIRATSQRIIQEKTSGQDVTEEFMDLDARIRNQKALETQFIEIMKRAGKVEDALSVQRELAEVRTEIEKLEGRRRFLENQSSLSTITVTLQPPTPIVNTTGFWYNVRSAFTDGVDVALAIILFLIRAVVALLPIALLIGLPLALILKFVVKRLRRKPVNEAEVPA